MRIYWCFSVPRKMLLLKRFLQPVAERTRPSSRPQSSPTLTVTIAMQNPYQCKKHIQCFGTRAILLLHSNYFPYARAILPLCLERTSFYMVPYSIQTETWGLTTIWLGVTHPVQLAWPGHRKATSRSSCPWQCPGNGCPIARP